MGFRSSARVGHNAGMAHAPNFKVAPTRAIVPTDEPAAELTALEDAARLVGLLRSSRQRYGIDARLFDWSNEITATTRGSRGAT